MTVPATVANLGPGFDCLGVAVGVYLKVAFEEAAETELTGKGRIRELKDSYIHRSFSAAFALAGRQTPQVRIDVVDDYASAKGLGASASAIVAGLAGAQAFGGLGLDDRDLARLASEIEGHPDNVLPALFGGLVLSLPSEGPPQWVRFEPTSEIAPLIMIAGQMFKTETARSAVPGEVSREDAVANAASTAALLAILTGNRPFDHLIAAVADRLHQPHRLPLMPESLELFEKLTARGIATALSGAGPSLIALVETAGLEDAAKTAVELAPDGWTVLTPGWDLGGARASRV